MAATNTIIDRPTRFPVIPRFKTPARFRPLVLVAICVVVMNTNTVGCKRALAQKFPTNNDPANQIRFHTASEAEARRLRLIKFIWKDGLPATLPHVTTEVPFPNQAIGINPVNVARVDRLDADVSGFDFHSISYLLHPKNSANANRVVMVHQGHADNLQAGVGATANHLLENGFTVIVMKMPLFNWSGDRTANLPGKGQLRFRSHDEMILKTDPEGGTGFRLFLEPVVQNINHVVDTMPNLEDIGFVGLSGGGWTASLISAIDKRIDLSVPVAGSAPLYVRNVDSSSVGDTEQFFLPLYDENIEPDGTGGGVATWLEIYALGAIGEGRRQIQVTNEFDNCCFPGKFPDTYKEIVAGKVRALGAGKWEHVLDSTHHTHQISPHIIATVIDSIFGISSPLPSPSGLPIAHEFNHNTDKLPDGWSIDPSSGSGVRAMENGGHLAIRGPSLASVVRDAPFNPQTSESIEITMRVANTSADNFPGVFITDDPASRNRQLGVLFNPKTKQLAVNADNGNGFSLPGDRLELGTVESYQDGPFEIKFTFDADGFAVEFSAGPDGHFSSGKRPWSKIPNGFDPKNLGQNVHLFIQSFDTDGNTPAILEVDSVTVKADDRLPNK